MKIFTLVSLLLMPPTLVASIYGMNVQLPLLGGIWDFLMIMLLMLMLVAMVIIIFRRRKML
jgi:magnesium transporter